jgi:REP element-mobilizing transposase RayT
MQGELNARVHAYIGGIVRECDCVPIEIGGMPDHVHLLARLSAKTAVAELVRVIKSNSSKWLHEQVGHAEFAWQTGYAAFSVSSSALDAVRAYIQRQEEHHKVRGYKKELIEFLTKHGIEYDDRYVWA